MNIENIKALLVQIREDIKVKEEELDSFARFSGLKTSQIKVLDVFNTPSFDSTVLNDIDVLFVGGASEASVLEPEKYPFVTYIKNLMNSALDLEVPTFASCFGFQAAVLAFGGEILKDINDFEMGTLPISLTDLALEDPVFKNTPNPFYAVSVHQEKAIKLPKNCTLLGFTDHCLHAFKVNKKPFWAFQFHPELDMKCLVQRLEVYKEKYTEDAKHLQEVLDNVHETPESNQLVRAFMAHVLNSSRF